MEPEEKVISSNHNLDARRSPEIMLIPRIKK
jgi:hypothetical protein